MTEPASRSQARAVAARAYGDAIGTVVIELAAIRAEIEAAAHSSEVDNPFLAGALTMWSSRLQTLGTLASALQDPERAVRDELADYSRRLDRLEAQWNDVLAVTEPGSGPT